MIPGTSEPSPSGTAVPESLKEGGLGQSMWGGRFAKPPQEQVQAFNASIGFDQRLALYDIAGSVAHAGALKRCGVLTEPEWHVIVSGLESLRLDVEAGSVVWQEQYEDVHMNIERYLTDKIGALGGKLHTGRSRNDQVALDMHMYAREQLLITRRHVRELQAVLVDLAQRHITVIIPGYTHLQRAQPVLLAHHLLAYFWMLERDAARLQDAWGRADWMPLGAAALAGSTFAIDRVAVAKDLGFSCVYENSLDAVSDRDYLLESLSALAIVAMHLSRLSEEIILWNTHEFGWIDLDDAFATGSSIMPQKKNPDVAELTRGKTGRVFGHLLALLTTCKGLPLAYNKDLQEDKEGVFDAFDTVQTTLSLTAAMLATTHFREDAIERALAGDFSAATDLADYLARKGMPFRQAHEVVGRLVRHCLAKETALGQLTGDDLRQFDHRFDDDALALVAPQAVIAARNVRGGTAPEQVRMQLSLARERLQQD